MQVLIAMILAALPNVFIAILGKLVTETFMQSVIEKVLIRTLQKAVTMTTNTVDDEVAQLVIDKLRTPKTEGEQ